MHERETMIQQIGSHIYSNTYHPGPAKDDSVILSYFNRDILLQEQGDAFSYPLFSQLPSGMKKQEHLIWLFTIDGIEYFLTREAITMPGYTYVPVNYLRAAHPRHLSFAGVTGLSLHNWYQNHIFCGGCGKPMQYSEAERMVYCDSCHTMSYPTICPAVIVGVRNGDKLLVSKYAGRDYKRFALLAGFAEIGETIEETVHREVMEEVGVKVKNLTFYKSQPWSFTDTLLFGFFCDVAGSDELHIDYQELSAAQWLDRKDLPDDKEKVSLTMEMMTLFKEGKA